MKYLSRRNFMGASCASVGAAASLTGLTSLAATADSRVASQNPAPKRQALMKLGTQEPSSEENFQRFARYGVRNVLGWYVKRDKSRLYPTVEELTELRDLGAKYGISIDMTNSNIGRSTRSHISAIMLGKSPERDYEIEAFQTTIKNCATAGIPAIKYYLSILPIIRTGTVKGRGDLRYRTWNIADANADGPLTAAGVVDADTYWERVTYFLDRVVPVANQYKIRIAQHPHDPPLPAHYRGIDEVLRNVAGLKRFVSIQESPYHGLNFCQGTIEEGLEDPSTQIFEVIRYFGERKKIFNVHFRNTLGHRGDFTAEIPPDVGQVDMFKAMLTYRDVGYDGMMCPDHISIGSRRDEGQQFVFDYGYIRALIQAAGDVA
jgi:mannonate dehydratase